MKIERDKVYLTRDGEKVRVVCVDNAAGAFPVVGLDEQGEAWLYRETGGFTDFTVSGNDLVSEYVEPPKPREVWVSLFPDGVMGLARTENEYLEETRHGKPDNYTLVKFREVIEA